MAAYAPIAQALNFLPVDEGKRLRVKFDIAYFVATEQLAYRKYPRIYKLEARHGVTWVAPTCIKMQVKISFTTLQNQRFNFLLSPKLRKFFSLVTDGSTDSSNTENKLLLVLWCDSDAGDENIHTRMRFLSIHKPQHVNAEGLLQSLEH